MANILIVDDERSIWRSCLEITFRKDGHRVEIATSGELARRRLEAKVFDIIISDIRMPDMSGIDLLAYAKEVSPVDGFSSDYGGAPRWKRPSRPSMPVRTVM